MAQPSSSTRNPSGARPGAHWVSETTDERFPEVTSVTVALGAGRIEIGRRTRDVRVRTTVAVAGWRARLAGLRPPAAPAVRRTGAALDVQGGHGQVRVRLDVPDGVAVTARIEDGDITLWGVVADLDLAVGRGTLAGRELGGSAVRAVNADGEVNLHFAAVPEQVDARARGAAVLVLPPGHYAVDAGAGAEVTVETAGQAASRVVVRGVTRTAVLAATGSERI